ncbi:hypothetical protein LOTGIDRAFT_171397 [Lottia gigantea]|uniref:NAD(+) kinase n=1 Tax=Lottia gigantea TaxID=225164 RepID=V4AHE4_LOTGI|nr:hypothetical protein LOTGIDRAFT_171397 [Lottia gigantea]ESP03459.1 hypothetical protein LOTGIDRAFT_171397 [Lottia gigantea]
MKKKVSYHIDIDGIIAESQSECAARNVPTICKATDRTNLEKLFKSMTEPSQDIQAAPLIYGKKFEKFAIDEFVKHRIQSTNVEHLFVKEPQALDEEFECPKLEVKRVPNTHKQARIPLNNPFNDKTCLTFDSYSLAGIEARVVNRWQFHTEAINWADVIFSAGGDGTFLLAASKIMDKSKPIIGINTDPER